MGWIRAVGGSLQVREEKERFVQGIFLGEIQNGTIETDENWNLNETGNASRQGIDFVLLVDLGNFLVHDFGIALVFGLQCFDRRLKCLWTRRSKGSQETNSSKRKE